MHVAAVVDVNIPQTTTEQLYVDSRSNSADRSSKNVDDSTWLPGR